MKSEKEGFGHNGSAVPTNRRFSDLPQVLPAKISAAEFALVLSMVTGAIIITAFWIAMIYAAVKPESS